MINVYGSAHCGRCKLVKSSLEKKLIPFNYELIENLSQEKQDELIELAGKSGVYSMPIVIEDGIVSKNLSNGVI